ncbi:unnamed protein product [Euphydryas editha]|uniref:Reverse transcriptase domain-containing protein n=1 Tax=Euphydryas editha TaxID=104508 RepID=A0AAU9VFJ2_EUPED|nr:unnamed protein product [Euphydryas editha]
MRNWQSECEDLWVTVDIGTSSSIAICVAYLPPPVQKQTLKHFMDNFNSVTEKLNKYHSIVIGDFNMGSIDWTQLQVAAGLTVPSSTHSILFKDFLDFTHLNNLEQYNTVCNVNNKILDLVLADQLFCQVTEATVSLSKIDPHHPPLDIVLEYHPDKALKPNKIIRYNYYKANYENINSELGKINWQELFKNIMDPNQMLDIFYERIDRLIKLFVPTTTKSNSSKPPWFNKTLKRCIREKSKYAKRYYKYKNPMDKISLQLCSKRYNKISKECYNSYINYIEEKITTQPKCFWSYMKAKRGGNGTYPKTMSNGESSTDNGDDICNMFASYFQSVYSPNTKLGSEVSTSAFLSRFKNTSDSFSNIKIDMDAIITYLKKLDRSKGAGSDDLSPIFLIMCADELAVPLSLIFNLSLSTGIFPEKWKLAKVVPIHKSDAKDIVSNYRPIAILPALGKVFEGLIAPILQSYFKKYVSDYQHGFTPARSTRTNLVTFVENIIEAVDSNKQVDAIYTDFSKAFDKVSHDVLIQKLHVYGFTDPFLKWLGSYLTNRYFYVVVNGYKSNIFRITSGVPQGSHLGPILFNIFINDLPECFSNSTAYLFADDLKIMRIVDSERDALLLQSDINELLDWCKNNGMELNINKCSQITFTRKNKPYVYNYLISGSLLNVVDTIKDLGVIIDRKLTFIPHIDTIIKKASKSLGFIIRNTKSFRKTETKVFLFNSLVRSLLEYCCVVWRPHYAVHSLRIERLQKRLLYHVAYSAGVAKRIKGYATRLDYFKIKTLEYRRKILDLLLLSKILNGCINCPDLLSKFKLRVPARYPRNPINLLSPPFRKTVLGSNSPVSRLCKLHNEYAQIDMFCSSLGKLKYQLHLEIK